MNTLKISFAAFFFISMFAGCKDSSTSSGGNSNNLQVLVYVSSRNYYYTDSGSVVQIPNTVVDGIIQANTLPQSYYVRLGTETFGGDSIFDYSLGHIYFPDYRRVGDIRVNSVLNPATVEVVTSFGSIAGSGSLPDSINTIMTFPSDTLPLGHSYTLSWNNTNADFYNVGVEYEMVDSLEQYNYLYFDTLLSAHSWTIDGRVFTMNGTIYINYITPINGPFPAPGAMANMSGSGNGFLYYLYGKWIPDNYEVIVGRGPYFKQHKHSQHSNEDYIRERLQHTISKKLGLNAD